MKIELNEIPIQDIVQYSQHLEIGERCIGYRDNGEEGVFGMGGRLNIRPPYQREFVYEDKQRDAVIRTVRKDFPLNTIYFAVNPDGSYEVIDGQQRILSICQYISGDFSVDKLAFYNLQDDEQQKILNYRLMVYLCEGTDSEKLDWFKTINIAGEPLEDQELRNAVYSGPWVSDAKRYFSRHMCPAHREFGGFLKGSAIRQDYLETVIKWKSHNRIEDYMSEHQFKEDAKELWDYFEKVVAWTKKIFITPRYEMKGLPFGEFYNKYSKNEYDPEKIEGEIQRLMMDDEVTKKRGIYYYIFTREEKYLNLRTFEDRQKREVYEKQRGICVHCKKQFKIEEMEADHIDPWSKGGKTDTENCQMLCLRCNRIKGGK